MKKIPLALSSLAILCASNAFADNGKLISINYTDEMGVGFNSNEPYVSPIANITTLGEARRHALEQAVEIFSTQFYSKQTLEWQVSYGVEDDAVESTTTNVPFQLCTHNRERDENSEESHHFLQNHQIYTDALHSAHTSGEASSLKSIPMETVFSENDVFSLEDVTAEDSLYSFVNDTMINAFGFAVTKNISDDPLYQYQYNYLTNFMSSSNTEGFSELKHELYFESLVSELNKHQLYLDKNKLSSRTLAYIENNIPNAMTEYGIALQPAIPYYEPDDPILDEPVDDSGEPNPDEPTVEKETNPNIDVVFSAETNERHSILFPNKLDLGLSAHVLCDIGWCQTSATADEEFSGQVIDLAGEIYTESDSTHTNRGIDVNFTIDSVYPEHYPIKNAILEITIPTDVKMNPLNDRLLNSESCTINNEDNTVRCAFPELSEQKSLWLRLDAPVGDYSFKSKVYSNASNIDSYGINNINSKTISFKGEVASDNDDSSGGSFGFFMLFLTIPLFILRKIKK